MFSTLATLLGLVDPGLELTPLVLLLPLGMREGSNEDGGWLVAGVGDCEGDGKSRPPSLDGLGMTTAAIS